MVMPATSSREESVEIITELVTYIATDELKYAKEALLLLGDLVPPWNLKGSLDVPLREILDKSLAISCPELGIVNTGDKGDPLIRAKTLEIFS